MREGQKAEEGCISDLSIPKVCGQIVALLAELEGDYFMHLEVGILRALLIGSQQTQ